MVLCQGNRIALAGLLLGGLFLIGFHYAEAANPSGQADPSAPTPPSQSALQKLAADLQGQLAEEKNPVLRRTRITRATIVSIANRKEPDLRLEGECFDELNQADTGERRKWFEEKCRALLADSKGAFRINTDVRVIRDPSQSIQALIKENPALDGLLLNNASFDKTGNLIFEGVVADPDQREALVRLLGQQFRHASGWRTGQTVETAVKSLRELRGWRTLLSDLQKKLVADKQFAFLRRTRLDRAYFDTAAKQAKAELRIEGVCFDELNAAAAVDRRKWLQDKCAGLLIDQELQYELNAQGIKRIADRSPQLQRLVYKDKALDGVLLRSASFDDQARLTFQGFKDNDAQVPTLVKLLTAYYESIPTEEGAIQAEAFIPLQRFPAKSLLRQLRQWASENLDMVRLDRLAFTKEGRLELSGISGNSGDAEKLKARLQELLDELPNGNPLRESLVSLAPAPQPPSSTRIPEIKLSKGQTITALRRLVSLHPSLDGVRLDQARYDLDGVLVVNGLLDSQEQKGRLQAFFQTLAKDADWQQQLTMGTRLSSFQIIPIGPMLERLEQVIPAFEMFDGLEITRAYHNEKNELEFAGCYVGRALSDEAKKQIRDWLLDHPTWKVRVSPQSAQSRLSFSGIKSEERDESMADRAFWAAQALVLKCDFNASARLLRTALRHSPSDSAAWCLLAICELARGHEVLAARWVRRMVTVERVSASYFDGTMFAREKPYSYGAMPTRYKAFERVQGSLRLAVEDLVQKVANDPDCGRPPVSLVDRK